MLLIPKSIDLVLSLPKWIPSLLSTKHSQTGLGMTHGVIAYACAITCLNQEKGSFGRQYVCAITVQIKKKEVLVDNEKPALR